MLLAVMIGTLAAYGLYRRRSRGGQALVGLAILPLALPYLVLGIALLSMFRVMGVQLSLVTVTIGHLLITLPVVLVTVNARFASFDPALEEAARDLGASPWGTFVHVTFPLIRPSVIGAGLLALALSLEDFIVSLFTIGAKSTVPIVIWGQMRRGRQPDGECHLLALARCHGAARGSGPHGDGSELQQQTARLGHRRTHDTPPTLTKGFALDAQWNNGTRFAGRTVIVTGGSGALGWRVGAVVRPRGRQRRRVVPGGQSAAEDLVADVTADGGEAVALRLDLDDAGGGERFAATVRALRTPRRPGQRGREDRSGRRRPLRRVRPSRLRHPGRRRSARHVPRVPAAVPHLRGDGSGAIVNFSGSYGNGINQENVVNSVAVTYCAAKGGVRAFTSALARDLAAEIRVNAIPPGPSRQTGRTTGRFRESTSTKPWR